MMDTGYSVSGCCYKELKEKSRWNMQKRALRT